jgi:carboxypeptidase Taq
MTSVHSDRIPDFTRTDPHIDYILHQMQDIVNLHAISELLEWDQNTAMPQEASNIRAEQLATFEGVLHEHWCNPQIGKALDILTEKVDQDTFTASDRALVRETRRLYENRVKLPRTLIEAISREEARGFAAWRAAKENNDFALFAPSLTRIITLQRELADRRGYIETPYDALVRKHEPGFTTSRLEELFVHLRDQSISLLQKITSSHTMIDDSCLEGDFPIQQQIELCKSLLHVIGYNFLRGSLAQSPHPFFATLGCPYDIRVTIKPDQHFIHVALMGALHEGGHAVYEQGSSSKLAYTPIGGGASIGMHEAQARFWENIIGRSQAFWLGQFPRLLQAFPEQFRSVDPLHFIRALNKVQPSAIRVTADEISYNLHIIIRFELEKALIDGAISVESLPRLWQEKYQAYLGIMPPSDLEGILQDVHWTGNFGYFPIYVIGNLYAVQIYATLRTIFPNFDDLLLAGDLSFLVNWLRHHIYEFGGIYTPQEIITRVTGQPLDSHYFIDYLNAKFHKIYHW